MILTKPIKLAIFYMEVTNRIAAFVALLWLGATWQEAAKFDADSVEKLHAGLSLMLFSGLLCWLMFCNLVTACLSTFESTKQKSSNQG